VGSSPTAGSSETQKNSGFEIMPQSRFSFAGAEYINHYSNAGELW
jgi:hypothetical protein